MSADFRIRPVKPADLPFIFNAWLAGYWELTPLVAVMTREQYWAAWHQVIEAILADERTAAVVACAYADEDQLFGFACGRKDHPILHWAYVKQALRRKNCPDVHLTKEMLGPEGLNLGPWVISSHWSPWFDGRDGWTCDPGLLKEYGPHDQMR
jgi:hypothetical protein